MTPEVPLRGSGAADQPGADDLIRVAEPQDATALSSFLNAHVSTSMFLLGNLERFGTQERDHTHGTTFLLMQPEDVITGVAGITTQGFLMCQAPGAPAGFWTGITKAITGRMVRGITGDPAQTGIWMDALGIAAQDCRLNQITPLFHLALEDLPRQDTGAQLRAAKTEDVKLLGRWIAGFHRDTGLEDMDADAATQEAQRLIHAGDLRVLMQAGEPVGMVRVNARAGDCVQIGGVYVPPGLRGQGYGSKVVALHLAELAGQGVRHAVLFAANEAAAKAYRRIGFTRIGSYRVCVLGTPMVVGDAATGSKDPLA